MNFKVLHAAPVQGSHGAFWLAKSSVVVHSINSVEYPNEAYVIIFNGTEWEVYYSERGKKRGLKKYLDESEACERFMNQISKI